MPLITEADMVQINVKDKQGWREFLAGPQNSDKIRGKNSQNITQTRMEVANPEVMDRSVF